LFQTWLLVIHGPLKGRSAFTYRQNASTHGPPTSSAVLANLDGFSLSEIPCETSEKRDRLGSGKNFIQQSLLQNSFALKAYFLTGSAGRSDVVFAQYLNRSSGLF
jgi:hypothetical protein